jgi:hypothetical protein
MAVEISFFVGPQLRLLQDYYEVLGEYVLGPEFLRVEPLQ